MARKDIKESSDKDTKSFFKIEQEVSSPSPP